MRKFKDKTCVHYDKTQETPREEAARARREAAKKAREVAAGAAPEATDVPPPRKKQKTASTGPQAKKFNVKTYKYHSLADYVKMIWVHGTTDGYSTQIVSLW